ncbi:tRNA epoxyqueuosine(34) reductase QueG [Schlesneria paludicola]|uniref:tRNA epoxyqueuosine(34) reductase QueG n=1 Tax=Schlesneria paludicola TaxID=360056 RepID=UPI00058FE430|nr:tRNA epoxyqueuosine(34) reductase QueG [Schlesneria paludicola]
MTDPAALSDALKVEAGRLGFDLVGMAPAVSPLGFVHFSDWIAEGFAGEMQYLPRRAAAYEHPSHVMPNVRSVVMLGMNYNTTPPRSVPERKSLSENPAQVARYAQGSVDYHDLLRGKLKQLADLLHELNPGCRTRGVVDTAPLLERDFARLAGLGWFGKNTMLINKRAGSWFLLAALLTDLELEPDRPHETSHCGTCTRCLDVCPTDAFQAPYVLDARRCISYLTIELRSSIPIELRDGIGDWLFGCDLCQDVCPWNHRAPVSPEPGFQPLPELTPVNAASLLAISEVEFKRRFKASPLGRPGWDGLRRNAAIVLGNSRDPRVLPVLVAQAEDPSPLVSEAVRWAIDKLKQVEQI